jgi:hypothetical protein
MKQHIEPPKGLTQEIMHAHMSRAAEEIRHYTTIFVIPQKGAKGIPVSGIFVNTCGYFGILTAHHVAKPVLENPTFGLCIAEKVHEKWLESKHFQHVPIGFIPGKPYDENGPDLSFIIIRDPNLLATLKSLKSFSYLDKKDLEYFESPLDRMNWQITGSPNEASQLVSVSPVDGPLVKYESFVGDAIFDSRTERDGFDYLKLRVPYGEHNFPKDYEGVSGGGMWLIPFSAESDDVNTIRYEAPILAGINFYQSDIVNNERIITGHGYNSIYSRVRQTLRELK